MNNDKKAILEELVFDEEEEFNKLVKKAKLLVKIKKSDGQPKLLHKTKLTVEEQIGCFILGKYFAKEMELVDSAQVDIDDISGGLGVSKGIARARLSDLASKEIIDRPTRGKYEISFFKLEEFLDNLLTKIKTE
ncbi:hypothetical protein [Methanobacterium subterraneum]|uniref:Uncharacterized protein n=1 Tax=Methanobacterium subterraneum TaxID=59277 RepID=A0A7K4DP81_9EURY|nr:hypothetical protein [Methanobacterium subterraneum]MBW4258148.1 hypothetical protein [Methanobacterium sp. YSL]NMO10149.1 hypothetical protein [Methanobacterium subterraneum]PKL73743.1 MAG: hypothetical protein CVV29_01870 [Methanobacteriales archaeon HGW-Methanobacteriales-2]